MGFGAGAGGGGVAPHVHGLIDGAVLMCALVSAVAPAGAHQFAGGEGVCDDDVVLDHVSGIPRPAAHAGAPPAALPHLPAYVPARLTVLPCLSQYVHQPWEHEGWEDHLDMSDEDDVFLVNLKAAQS